MYYVQYIQYKREKQSKCNLCSEIKSLSWDHVPPQGGIELTPVEMQSVFQILTGNPSNSKPVISQNGVKYRTICSACNSFLGKEFDPTLNEFARSVSRYLKSTIHLPEVIHHKTKPQRLIKAVLGHLVSAKIKLESTISDQLMREYVLGQSDYLSDEINIFYWIYPYSCSITMRDFAMFVPRGTFKRVAYFETMKYFPIAYLVCNETEYAGLDSLSRYKDCELDEEVKIPIRLNRVEHEHWPEAPDGIDNDVVFVGSSACDAIMARPKI